MSGSSGVFDACLTRPRKGKVVFTFLRTRKTVLVASTTLSFAAIGGIAMAVDLIPASDGTITGCYQFQTGALRVVTESSACLPSERTITWNQRGERGPAGPPGPQGPAGEPGSAGAGGVVARARSTGSLTSEVGDGVVTVPLTDATWTQAADETDFVFGEVVVNIPSGSSDPQCDAQVYGQVGIDGDFTRSRQVRLGGYSYGQSGTRTVAVGGAIDGVFSLFEPGQETQRSLSFRTFVECGMPIPPAPPPAATDHWTIESVKLNVGAWK